MLLSFFYNREARRLVRLHTTPAPVWKALHRTFGDNVFNAPPAQDRDLIAMRKIFGDIRAGKAHMGASAWYPSVETIFLKNGKDECCRDYINHDTDETVAKAVLKAGWNALESAVQGHHAGYQKLLRVTKPGEEPVYYHVIPANGRPQLDDKIMFTEPTTGKKVELIKMDKGLMDTLRRYSHAPDKSRLPFKIAI